MSIENILSFYNTYINSYKTREEINQISFDFFTLLIWFTSDDHAALHCSIYIYIYLSTNMWDFAMLEIHDGVVWKSQNMQLFGITSYLETGLKTVWYVWVIYVMIFVKFAWKYKILHV